MNMRQTNARPGKDLTKEDLILAGVINITADGKHVFLRDGAEAYIYPIRSDQGSVYYGFKLDKLYRLHRAVYAWHKGIAHGNMIVDHINGDHRDNSINNLQELTYDANMDKSGIYKQRYVILMKTDEDHYESIMLPHLPGGKAFKITGMSVNQEDLSERLINLKPGLHVIQLDNRAINAYLFDRTEKNPILTINFGAELIY